jgi:hypothetical protein
MNRHPQWEARLHALIEKSIARPYEWGRWDCLMLAAEAAKAITGKDHARGHRVKYKSQASAYRYLKQQFKAETPEALLDSLFDRKPVGFAGRGDIVMGDDGIPMLCMGAFALSIAEGTAGLVKVPRDQWRKAWAVGEHHSSWPDVS